MGDEKLTIISVAVRGVNDHIRFYSQMSSVIVIDSATGSPVHVLMLSIHAVCGLPRLHCYLMVRLVC